MENKELEITADLARLTLTDQEKQPINAAIEQMLEFFTHMDGFDFNAAKDAELSPDEKINYLRPDDLVLPGGDCNRLINAAPDSEEGAFKVPRVV